LRRWWLRWREALVLVQPATVARWHREGFRGCWSRRSRRRPRRSRIDSQLRTLIRRMATENRLWGAPRIHGKLLKLGVTVSERTVSRYLPDRLTRPSQTRRTFLANHLGNLAFASTVTSLFGESDDEGVNACGLPFRPVPPSRDGRYASSQWAFVDWPPSLQPTSRAWRVVQDQFRRRTRTRFSSGKDPPQSWTVDTSAGGVRLKVRDVPGLHLAEGVHVGLRPSDSEALRRHRQALGQSVRNHRW
jgi:hypothetical protein